MNERETLLVVGALAFGWILLRRPSQSGSPAAQLAAQQLAAQQLAAQQLAAAKPSQGSQAAQILAGIGQGLGSVLQGIGSLTGGGSGTNKENGGNYTYESTAVVDEYEAMPSYYYDSDDDYYGVD